MKTLIAVAALALLAGCQSRTDYGDCVGMGDKQNPNLQYKLSVRNVTIGVLTLELIVPPVVVAANETFCPVGPAQ